MVRHIILHLSIVFLLLSKGELYRMITVKELVRFREQLNNDSIEEETAAIIGYIYAHEKKFFDEAVPDHISAYINGWIDGIDHKPSVYAKDVLERKRLDNLLTYHIKPVQPVEPVNPDYPGEEIAREQLKNKGEVIK